MTVERAGAQCTTAFATSHRGPTVCARPTGEMGDWCALTGIRAKPPATIARWHPTRIATTRCRRRRAAAAKARHWGACATIRRRGRRHWLCARASLRAYPPLMRDVDAGPDQPDNERGATHRPRQCWQTTRPASEPHADVSTCIRAKATARAEQRVLDGCQRVHEPYEQIGGAGGAPLASGTNRMTRSADAPGAAAAHAARARIAPRSMPTSRRCAGDFTEQLRRHAR